MRPVEVRNGYFKAHCLVAELDASVLQHASGRQPQAWTKATQLCKQAEQTGSARANYYRKGSKSDSSGCLQRRGTAAGVQANRHGVAPGENHAFIAYARPMTIT